ncbi:NAD(P)/FAD-dependent oxidoreductase [Rhodoferax mekongensis]|uniref:NAD(P)-binding protein n=1 Tax=Rhodoferax mekongensis TaxID=3068341 RepID=A0ABZ0AW65_9BURK|nr:NAD(P)-binding protein [Rhodoferax sp. TBRC 17307]WNO03848.1 NAD(P)-binding protein [Rhodoferax sp. TBRC 17307]
MSDVLEARGGAPATCKKVAILGGGISALTTAFELTSQPDWQQSLDITIYQMGWRLGGKCATARGEHMRIEEHGIHGFLGSYYNALPVMRRCYEALGRQPGQPLATFEEAFKPESFVLMWEYIDGKMSRWPFTSPRNDLIPGDLASLAKLQKVEHWVAATADVLDALLDHHASSHSALSLVQSAEWAVGRGLVKAAVAVLQSESVVLHGADSVLWKALDAAWDWVRNAAERLAEGNTELRRLLIVAEFLLAILRGCIKDEVATKGFDQLDDENFSDWLIRHGASVMVASSPMALNTVNLSYQYPKGDTARTALMGAGCYLHWTLRSFAYAGAFAWLFEAGTGETVIAPLYEVLKKRGVKFEFFHKVEGVHLNAQRDAVESVRFGVQARLKNPERGYDPLIDVKGLPAWPGHPKFEQLEEGEALRAGKVDLESYWNGWKPVAQRELRAGRDFDHLVFAISIGAVPYLCKELLEANPAWKHMVEKVTTVQTQTMQLWMNRSTTDMGWDIEFKNPTDTVIGATYLNPLDGQVDFTHLLKWEDWPADSAPQSLWYFSGAMAEYEAPPPFEDTAYPARAYARVQAQCVQYLQASMGPLLPKATTNVISPPGDPMGLDFSVLRTDPARPAEGVQRFNQQFWRANIDPTESYVTSPPGSTAARLKAWGTGFANLSIAGDWIYTGLNVGSVEGAVMGGRLASFAVSGYPALTDIVGFPASQGPV